MRSLVLVVVVCAIVGALIGTTSGALHNYEFHSIARALTGMAGGVAVGTAAMLLRRQRP